MEGVTIEKFTSDKRDVAIITYKGEDDPVKKLDDAIAEYIETKDHTSYKEFIDSRMSDPYVRVIIFQTKEKIKVTKEELLHFDFTRTHGEWKLKGETYEFVEKIRTNEFSDGESWDTIVKRKSDDKYFKWNCWDGGDHIGYIMSDGDEYQMKEVIPEVTKKVIYK